MKDQLISFETAKLAKERKFDSVEHNYYNKNGELTNFGGTMDNKLKSVFVAPTQSLLQKWLRKEHNIHISLYPLKNGWGMDVRPTIYGKSSFFEARRFKTFEQALEKGLQEALKLI